MPAIFANELPIIVVGAVNNFGYPAAFSQGGPLVTTYGPGVNILCAGIGNNEYHYVEGTSFCTCHLPLLFYYISLTDLNSYSCCCWLSCLLLISRFDPAMAKA